MIPRNVRDCVTLLLPVILMVAFSVPLTKQCKPTTTGRDGSVIIRNICIKQCRLKCSASGQNVSAQYDINTLTCHLLSAESRKTKTKDEHVSLARKHSNISAGSCSSKCSVGQRCVKTRSGKFTCLQDVKNFPEKPPQQEDDKEDTLANSPLHEACRKGNLTLVRHIVFQGLIDINSRDGNHGKTPFMVAAQGGHCRIFNFLIKKGANMSQVDNDGKNFLHWACKGGHVGMVECIVSLYHIAVDNIMPTPLMQAAYQGYRDVCEFLVCMGANVSHTDGFGDSVLHWACKSGHLGVVKYLLSGVPVDSRGAFGKTPLMTVAVFGHTDVGQLLVSVGANLSQVDYRGQNILHYCCKYERLELMKSVLSQGNVDINSREHHQWTPLMKAAYYGKRIMFDLLVSKGALTHLVNDHGHNILHLATISGRVEIVKHILSQNMTHINARNEKGKTAAMIANHASRIRVYNLLVSRGCLVK